MKALVIFSGGQDSTTCLGWAKKQYSEVEAITFNYSQNHKIEIDSALAIALRLNVSIKLVNISFFADIVDSALTSKGDVNQPHSRLKELPASFVPNRNSMFITIAHAYAQRIGAEVLVTGVCETDYSGYPDCRMEFIQFIQKTLNLGSGVDIKIETPLMYLNKAQIFSLAEECDVLDEVINLSHTCYNGDHSTFHAWGYGCGECPACKLRENGWNEFTKNAVPPNYF